MSQQNTGTAIDYQAWLDAFTHQSENLYVDLSNRETFDRIVFIAPEKKHGILYRSALGERNGAAHTPIDEVKLMTDLMREGYTMYVYPPGENTPRQIKMDQNNRPYSGAVRLSEEPKAPERPNLWKRFAHAITRGRAYSEDFREFAEKTEQYEADKLEYDNLQRVNSNRANLEPADRERETAYKAEVSAQRVAVKKIKDNEIGKERYSALFAPTANVPEDVVNGQRIAQVPYQAPAGMSEKDATIVAFAACILKESLQGIQWTTSSIPTYGNDVEQAKIENQRTMLMENLLVDPSDSKRHPGLTDAIVNARTTMQSISSEFNQGNFEPMGRVMNSAIIGVMEQWRTKEDIQAVSSAVYGHVMEDILSCLETHPQLKEAGGISDDLLKSAKLTMDVMKMQRMSVDAVNKLITATPAADSPERGDALAEVIAGKLFALDYRKTHDAQRTPIQEAALDRAGGDPDRFTEALYEVEVWTKQRPMNALELRVAEDPAAVKAEYLERARQTDVFRDLISMPDAAFREKIAKIASDRDIRVREPVTVNELSGRTTPQPQVSHERVSAHTMSHEAERQMNQ